LSGFAHKASKSQQPKKGEKMPNFDEVNEDTRASLLTLARGAAIERFDAELQRVLDNIIDPNTSEKQGREITLKVKFKPNETRSATVTEIHCSSKIAPPAPCSTMLWVGKDRGKGVAIEAESPDQMAMFNQQASVALLRKGGETQ
jgi:hypothetical protein